MSDRRYWIASTIAAVMFLIAVIGIGIAVDNHNTHVQCLRVHEQSGLPTRVIGKASASCYVNISYDRWIPLESWRNIDE